MLMCGIFSVFFAMYYSVQTYADFVTIVLLMSVEHLSVVRLFSLFMANSYCCIMNHVY